MVEAHEGIRHMYGLPRDIDLSFFLGKALIQVSFGAHDLNLSFDDDVVLHVTSRVGVGASDGTIRQSEDYRQVAEELLALLTLAVASAEGEESGTLTLKFAGDRILVVYDDSDQYESYVIKNSDQLIVV